MRVDSGVLGSRALVRMKTHKFACRGCPDPVLPGRSINCFRGLLVFLTAVPSGSSLSTLALLSDIVIMPSAQSSVLSANGNVSKVGS